MRKIIIVSLILLISILVHDFNAFCMKSMLVFEAWKNFF